MPCSRPRFEAPQSAVISIGMIRSDPRRSRTLTWVEYHCRLSRKELRHRRRHPFDARPLKTWQWDREESDAQTADSGRAMYRSEAREPKGGAVMKPYSSCGYYGRYYNFGTGVRGIGPRRAVGAFLICIGLTNLSVGAINAHRRRDDRDCTARGAV